MSASSRRLARVLGRAQGDPRPQIEAERAKRRLRDFVRAAWHVVEPPSRPFVSGWHIDAICEHLEAVTDGEIRHLLVNLPPRHMKSLAVSVFWPAWVWIAWPHLRWLCASYAQSLSTRDSLRTRRLIRSRWYRKHFGASFRFVGDQNQKTRFENDKTGYRLATSVGGAATGEGGDIIIIDDPHNVTKALSETTRARALLWWDEVMSTRLNDPGEGAMVIVMQRLHENDLSGHVLAEGGWEHLMLPAEFEPDRRSMTSIGFADPRDREGEILWPARFPKPVLEQWKKRLGTFGAAGQLQQRPSPRGGGMVKLGWFKRYREAPADQSRVVQSWDTANKPGAGHDYSVCTTWAEAQTGYYLLEVFRERRDYPGLKRAALSLAEKWRPNAVLIEDKGSGQALIQDLKAGNRFPVIAVEPRGDKEVRMGAESPAIEAGLVFLPERAAWLADFEAEIAAFPAGSHDDQVDSVSQFLKWVRKRGTGPRVRIID